MSRPAPIAAGFRAAFRRPALVASEIAWRWSCGAAAWLMVAFAFFTYLHSIRVTNADMLLIRSRVPALVAQAIQDIFRGTGPMLLRAAAVLLPAISILWIAAASIGRWASLSALLDERRGRFRTVLGLHFLRAAAGLAALIGYLFALLVAGFAASRGYDDRPGLFLLVFLIIAGIISLLHGRVRWYLSLASIFAVRDGSDAFASISAAFDAYRDRRNDFLTLALAMWAIRLFFMGGATFASMVPLGAAQAVSGKTVLLLLALITLIYCALADFLFVVRQAAYVAIVSPDSEPEPAPVAPPSAPEPVSPTARDLPPTTAGPTTDDQGPTTPVAASS